MKTQLFILMLFPTIAVASCKEGYVPTDVDGVFQKSDIVTNPGWVSEEKPPSDKMPSYQREGIIVIDAPNMRDQDMKDDLEKAEADRQGKMSAGIKPTKADLK